MKTILRVFLLVLLVFFAPLSSEAIPRGGQTAGGTLPDFNLVTARAGTNTLPFAKVIAFPQGASFGAVHLNSATSGCTVFRTWNDGSNKEAFCAGTQSLTQNVLSNVQAVAGAAGGSANTCSDIATMNPSASITVAGTTENLSSLLASPLRTAWSVVGFAECEYTFKFSNGVWGFFNVRCWIGIICYVRTTGYNGAIDLSTSNQTYAPSAVVNGTTVYNPGSLTHYDFTRWTAHGWTGTDPQITVQDDTAYLRSTRVIPNYYTQNPDANLVSLVTSFTYNTPGDYQADMPSTGAQPQIGPMSLWDAVYVESGGAVPSTIYQTVLADAENLGNFPIIWRDPATGLPGKVSAWSTWSSGGNNQAPNSALLTTPASPTNLTFDTCHGANGGTLAFLETGELFFAEEMEDVVMTWYLEVTPANGTGVNRDLRSGTVRCAAWQFRNLGWVAALAPVDTAGIEADYASLLAVQASNAVTTLNTSGMNNLGVTYAYDILSGQACSSPSGPQSCSLFMTWFYTYVWSYLEDLQPGNTTAQANVVTTAAFQESKLAVPTMGDGTGTTFCYANIGASFNYVQAMAPVTSVISTNWEPDWNHVTNNPTVSGCGNTLAGDLLVNGNGMGSFQNVAAIAVDHGATGALAGWTRITGTTNWASFLTGLGVAGNGCNDNPNFCIKPH